MTPRSYPTFGAALRQAMRVRKRKVADLATEVGYSFSNLSSARNGHQLPHPETIARLAGALDAPRLVAIADAYRERVCVECERRFTQKPTSPVRESRFCSQSCRAVWHRRNEREERRDTLYSRLVSANRTATELRRRLTADREDLRRHEFAVAAFCRDCEFDSGACKDASCPLRPVSPLPLVGGRVA